MSQHLHILPLIAAACLALTSAPSQALPRYEVFDLGALLGTSSSGAQINESGQVIGTFGADQSFLFTPGAGVSDVATLLGAPGGTASHARGLNNLGQVVGTVGADSGFIYRPGTAVEYVAAPLYGPNRINDAGQYSGVAYDGGHGYTYRFTPGTGVETIPLYDVTSDMNQAGQMAGFVSDPGTGENRAARYDDVSGLTLLGALGGAWGQSRAINNAGDVVGYAATAANVAHAFRYTDAGGMVDLDSFGFGVDGYSVGEGINDQGWVIGAYGANGADPLRPFFTDGTGMVDLHTLLEPSASGWTLLDVSDINNAGQIVGTGTFGGQTHAFILNAVAAPVPEPEAWVAMLLGLGLVGVRRRPAA